MSRGLTVLLLPALSGGVALGIVLADIGADGLIPAEVAGFGALVITAGVTRAGPSGTGVGSYSYRCGGRGHAGDPGWWCPRVPDGAAHR